MAFVGSLASKRAGPRPGNSIHLPLVGGNSNSRRRNVVPQAGTELAYYCLRNVYVTSHTHTLHQYRRAHAAHAARQSESASRLVTCEAATIVCFNSFAILTLMCIFQRIFIFPLELCVCVCEAIEKGGKDLENRNLVVSFIVYIHVY